MRRLTLFLVLVALVLGAAGAQQAVRRMLAAETFSTGSAEWIWDRDRHRLTVPSAFWAVRDFDLEVSPRRAELLVRADESYVVHLNGRRIGSNHDRVDAPVDRYFVTPWLRAGRNRLAVELRSQRGAGGLLLALLEVAEGGQEEASGEPRGSGPRRVEPRRIEPRLWTDSRWTIFRQDHPGILGGWLPVTAGEPAFSWGLPPVGRWGVPRPVVDRPSFPRAVGEGWEMDALPARRVAAGPRLLQALTAGRGNAGGAPAPARGGPLGWRPVRTGDANDPGPGLGTAILFDWGREVTGYLSLVHREGGRRAPGLLRVGLEPPAPRVHGADAAVLTPPGGEVWRDAIPRRFRYALVLGADSVAQAWVEPLREPLPEELRREPSREPSGAPPGEGLEGYFGGLPTPPEPVPGVFGVDAPELATPVEHEVRRKLQRLASRARGEDL